MAKKMTAEQMISRIFSMTRGMVSPDIAKAEAASRKKNVKRGMAKGGNMKSKGMAKGGKMKSKGMARGGKAKR